MNVMDRLRAWLKTPAFEDEDTARNARLLQAISLTILGVSIAYSLLVPVLFLQPEHVMPIIVVSWVIVLSVLVLVRRGRVSIAIYFFVVTFWLYFAGIAYYLGGVGSNLLILQVITFILAALLLGGSAALVVTALTIFVNGVLAFLETQGLLPLPFLTMTPFTMWLAYAAIYTVIGALLYYAMRGFHEALRRARRNEQALAEQNLILEASEEKFARAFQTSPHAITIKSPS